MADRHAIAELFVRYAAANDLRDLALIEATLAEDASVTIHIADGDTYGPFEPRTGVLEFYGQALGAQTDRRRHLITNLIVVDEEGDRARVNAYLTLVVTDNGRTEVKSAGLYETEVVAEGGEWRFSSMVLSLDNGF